MGWPALYVILFGAPGSGKGTQAALLAQEMRLAHIATGDMFREEAQKGSELGELAKAYMDKGQLVPDAVTIDMLMQRIERPQGGAGFILDGFPRTLEQAQALDEALALRGATIDAVLYLKVSPETLLQRLAGRWTCRQCRAVYHEVYQPPQQRGRCDCCGGELYQRDDDRPETARRRLAVYLQETAPLLDYYRRQGKLRELDGEDTREGVGRSLLAALGVLSSGS